MGRLAGGVAHDFNNLLSVMLSYARFARDELEPGEVRNDVQEVVTAGEKAAELIQQLLTFSRRRFVAPETLDLNEVVGGMEKIFRRTLAENISTSINLSADPLLVDADTGQIEQVLLNLVVNARDAMPNGGNLSVSTWNVAAGEPKPPALPDGEYACLAVTDTGTGIDEETLSQMFEPFFTTKPSGRGTGLGLSTIYGVVSQWGGHIDVDTQVGLGTTFLIYLPVASSGHRSKRAPSSNGLSLHGNETVLVVEDEETVRELTKRMLESAGYRTVPAADASEALKVAQDDPSSFDLLLTDVVMPEMSGSELSQRIGELKPGLHTIYMSGYPQDVVASQGVNDEQVALLPKPFTPQALLEMVRRNLDSRSEHLEDAGA